MSDSRPFSLVSVVTTGLLHHLCLVWFRPLFQVVGSVECGLFPRPRNLNITHVEPAAHDVADQAGAIFAQQLDLAAGAVNRGVNVGGGLVEIADDGGLLGEGGEGNVYRLVSSVSQAVSRDSVASTWIQWKRNSPAL